MDSSKQISLLIFASDIGPGDAERGSIMVQAGAFLAGKKNAKFYCYVEQDNFCAPLISSIHHAGGNVTILADNGFEMPSALSFIEVKKLSKNKEKKYQQIDELCDGFIALPGSLLSAKSLLEIWSASKRKKPVAILNKNKNFEFLRGFIYDIAGVKNKKIDKQIVFSDNIEDLWSRLLRILN